MRTICSFTPNGGAGDLGGCAEQLVGGCDRYVDVDLVEWLKSKRRG